MPTNFRCHNVTVSLTHSRSSSRSNKKLREFRPFDSFSSASSIQCSSVYQPLPVSHFEPFYFFHFLLRPEKDRERPDDIGSAFDVVHSTHPPTPSLPFLRSDAMQLQLAASPHPRPVVEFFRPQNSTLLELRGGGGGVGLVLNIRIRYSTLGAGWTGQAKQPVGTHHDTHHDTHHITHHMQPSQG